MTTLRLAITAGEPAGIGPDLCIQIAQQAHEEELVVIADPDLLKRRAELLDLPLEIHILTSLQRESAQGPTPAGHLNVFPVDLAVHGQPGQLDARNARYVITTLETAADACLNGDMDAVVTAPVHKGIINDAGIPFTGHTELFQMRTGVDRVVMMLATQGLRVALATTHLPLSQVSQAITEERLEQVIRITVNDLKQSFGIDHPCLLIAGLNPHAGEGGYLGHEENDVIIPTLQRLRTELNAELIGPLPADTLFTAQHLEHADAALAMYHDQGLPVLKYKGFGHAANITLGMPIIRTSVDHGTALDLAGTGKASADSLLTAIEYAGIMAHWRHQNIK